MRAIKDISKEEEVSIFYPKHWENFPLLGPSVHRRQMIKEDYGFDCKCPVCSGEVPDQEDILRKIADIVISYRLLTKDENEMTYSNWTREVIPYEAIVELDKIVYMGSPEAKMAKLVVRFFKAAAGARRSDLLRKAVDAIKEFAEKTGLDVFKEPTRVIKDLEIEKLMEQGII